MFLFPLLLPTWAIISLLLSAARSHQHGISTVAGGDSDGDAERDLMSVEYMFGSNAQYFTVCRSTACCARTLQLPAHAEKLILFIFTVHVDGDSYLSYYMGLIFDTFLFRNRGNGTDDPVNMHIVVLSVSHSMSGGPYGDAIAVDMVRDCRSQDYSTFSPQRCTEFVQRINDVSMFTELGGLYHKNLALVVLNDAVIMASYAQIALKYFLLHNTSLFAIIHLNHEQPWLDNQSQSTEQILAAYRATRIVFRTHYFSDFMAVTTGTSAAYEGTSTREGVLGDGGGRRVQYLPLGPGLLQTERMALGLNAGNRRFPPTRDLLAGAAVPPSRRPWLCSFAGSTKYKYNRAGHNAPASRTEMLQTLRGPGGGEGGVPGCIFHPTDDVAVSAPLTQKEYMQLTMSTIFSLCPRGVGPETNRPYQALELGAIPIMIREGDVKKDFLVEWANILDYPGPIFSSWREAKCFLYDVISGHISMHAIDELQNDLKIWYASFQQRQSTRVEAVVHAAMTQRDHEDAVR